MNEHESWATEVGDVLVSTRYRESSALVNNAPWYWETFAFKAGRIVWESWGYYLSEALRQHNLAVRYFGSRP